jgi:hypothetical protein
VWVCGGLLGSSEGTEVIGGFDSCPCRIGVLRSRPRLLGPQPALMGVASQVHIVTYAMDVLQRSGLPLKDSIMEYSEGITVHRPDGVGDYKVSPVPVRDVPGRGVLITPFHMRLSPRCWTAA